MTTPHKLAQACQRAVHKRLAGWHKRSSIGVYRRSDDFVQWIILDRTSYGPIRPTFAVQALATQFPVEALTIGDFVRTAEHNPLSIEWDAWNMDQERFIEDILAATQPPITTPLVATVIMDYLKMVPNNHVDFLVARGIASVVLGQNEGGRHHLEQALKQYSQMDVDWAREEEQRIRSWLACSDATLLAKLREDAQAGAATLKLK